MKKGEMHLIGHTLVRLAVGLMFIFAGYRKVTGMDGVIGMLSGISFPLPVFLAWVLALSELIFGALVFVGYKTKYTVWPLAFIMVVAWLAVVIPNQGITSTGSFFHLIATFALVTIAFAGPGKWALSEE